MKKKTKIAILGSTGSIGKTTFNIIKKDKKNYEVCLLSTNKNINEIIKQANYFDVKNLIVTDINKFEIIKNRLRNLMVYWILGPEKAKIFFEDGRLEELTTDWQKATGLKTDIPEVEFKQ